MCKFSLHPSGRSSVVTCVLVRTPVDMDADEDGKTRSSDERLFSLFLSFLSGHSEAVRYFRQIDIPAIFLGGGGYTLRNVPRCWAKETGYILGLELNPSKNMEKKKKNAVFARSQYILYVESSFFFSPFI